MNEAEKEADAIIEMFTKGIKEKAVITNPVRFAAKQCALIHVNGIIEALERYASLQMLTQWADAIGEWQEVKTIIENK